MASEIEKTKLLYEKIMGEKAEISMSFEAILERLRNGEKGIIVELPLEMEAVEEKLKHIIIVLNRIEKDRIYYYNAIKKPDVARDIEESMDLDSFKQLFQKGGFAILENLSSLEI